MDFRYPSAGIATVVAALLMFASSASAVGRCNLYASPTGSDSNAGTIRSPFGTVQKLDGALGAGQVGCLRAGKYASGVETTFSNAQGVTITSYPGEHATIAGFPYIPGAGTKISYVDIDLDMKGWPWPALCQGSIPGGAYLTGGVQVDASNVTIEHDNIYVDPSIPITNRGLAVGVGFQFQTSGDVIRNNRIHDIGFCPVEEHGVYLGMTSGAQVYGNWIYNIPAGTGVQVWDGPTHAHVYSNVIDNASSCFTLGGNAPNTNDNKLDHNVCTNSFGLQDPYKAYCVNPPGPGCTGPDPGVPIWTYWGGGTGSGNSFSNNLDWCAPGWSHCTTTISDASGLAVSRTTTADPKFADPDYARSHDYRVASTSPAVSWGLWNGR